MKLPSRAFPSLAVAALLLPCAAQTPARAGEFHLLRTLAVGGEGGWDYLTVEPGGQRLFVSRSSHVMVVDTQSGKVVGDIPDTAGVHGIALAPELGRGFTSNGKAGTSTIFDLKTLAALGTVPVGQFPDAILFEPRTQDVFVFNGKSRDVTVFEAATGAVRGTLALGGKPEFAVADGAGKVFVNLEDTSEVVTLDAHTRTVLARWPLAPGEEPTGLALDAKHARLFATCGNHLMIVLDAESGQILAAPAIGDGADGAGFDPELGLAFASNGDGTLSVVREEDPRSFRALYAAPTAFGARTMALDPQAHLVYLSVADAEAPSADASGRARMKAGSFRILVLGR